MPTIMDVARAAGVGIGTVSRVLNGSRLVSPATRQRVQDAIQRLGYQPSPIARAFGRGRTDKLEVLIPAFAHAFLLEILLGIQDALSDSDYAVVIRIASDAAERERLYQECCVRGRADGVLVVWMTATDAFVDRLDAESLPAVLLNALHPRLTSIGVDHDDAAVRAFEYCAGLGHRRIGLIDRRQDPFDPATPGICQRGYENAVAHTGYALVAEYERLAEPSASAGAAAIDALLELAEPPTAVVVASDAQAIGVLEAARATGRRVPEDLSVVGYNDTPVTRDLGVTTMHVPLRELGRVATESLLELLAEPATSPRARNLPTELMVRRTCAPPTVR